MNYQSLLTSDATIFKTRLFIARRSRRTQKFFFELRFGVFGSGNAIGVAEFRNHKQGFFILGDGTWGGALRFTGFQMADFGFQKHRARAPEVG